MAIPEGYERYVKEKPNKDTLPKVSKGNLWFSPSSKTMVEEV
jgi:hypothetical protein